MPDFPEKPQGAERRACAMVSPSGARRDLSMVDKVAVLALMTTPIAVQTFVMGDPLRFARLVETFAFYPDSWRGALAGSAGAHIAPWSALTYAALHANWGHALSNVALLGLFGVATLRRAGALGLGAICCLAAVAGAFAQASAGPQGGAAMVGASACASGLAGAALRYACAPAPLPPFFQSLRGRTEIAALCGAAAAFAFAHALWPQGAGEPSLSWRAHAAGFAVGLCLAGLVERRALR
jgi:membrane associated rhomboid family serine protease